MLGNYDLHQVLSSLPLALVAVDERRQIVGANSAALGLFGYTEEDLLGQTIEVLIPKRYQTHHQAHVEGYMKAPNNRNMGSGRDLLAVKKDGTEFPVEVGLSVVNTEPRRFLASVLDLSYRKRSEALLEERQYLLETTLAEVRETLEKEISEKTRLEERQRLGRELHDSLSQNLYGIGLGLRTSLAKIQKQQDPIDPLKYCLNLTEVSLVEMRALLFRLRPKSLENVPLNDVLQSHCQAVSARSQIAIHFEQISQAKGELGFEQKYALYRIVTEALHNSVKHSKATTIWVRLIYDMAQIRVEVVDNGRGFQSGVATSGHGLATMQERATAVHGTLDIEATPEGTSVRATCPWHYSQDS